MIKDTKKNDIPFIKDSTKYFLNSLTYFTLIRLWPIREIVI